MAWWERITSGFGLRAGAGNVDPNAGKPPSEWTTEAQLDFILGESTDRTRALRVATLFRCVTLISSTVAEIISNSVYAVDFERRWLDPQPDDIRHLLRTSPDDLTTGYAFIEDLMMDLLLEGNALVVIDRMDGKPYRLRRMISRTATCTRIRNRLIYEGEIVGPFEPSVPEAVDSANIVHARWSDMSGRDLASSRGPRSGFVATPLVALSDDLQVSRDIIRWIAKFFSLSGGTVKSDTSIVYPSPLDEQAQKKVIEGIAEISNARRPLILFGDPKVNSLKTTPQDAETANLRNQEVENIGRLYGIPPPLMGLHTTQWGSGVSELARLYWTSAARPAMNRLIQPLSLRLLPKGQDLVVNESEMLRGDITALTSLMAVTKGSTADPILGRSEHRSLLGVDTPFPEGDDGSGTFAPMPSSVSISWAPNRPDKK